MSADLNYCIGGGYVVGPSSEVPDDPSAYHSDWQNLVGCNNLVCGQCGARVRQLRGVIALDAPQRLKWSEVYDTPDWSTLGWLRKADARMYVCRCTELDALSAEPSDQLEETRNISWACGGHPPSSLPIDIDGIAITRFADLRKLLREGIVGSGKLSLRKAFERLRGTPLQSEVERIAQSFLSDGEPQVRRSALGFYWAHPEAAGGTRVLELAEGDRALFQGVPDEALAEGNDLEARLFLTLGELWINDAVDGARARRLVRAEAETPTRLCPTLASLARKDTEWLMRNAEQLIEKTPGALGKLIIELERTLGSAPQLLELAKRSCPRDVNVRAAVRRDVETYVTSSLREPLLEILR